MAEYTELAMPGKVRLYHKSGKVLDVYPIDAQEILSAEDSEYSREKPADVEAVVDETEEVEEEDDGLEDKTRSELMGLADEQGLTFKTSATKAELIALLRGGDE